MGNKENKLPIRKSCYACPVYRAAERELIERTPAMSYRTWCDPFDDLPYNSSEAAHGYTDDGIRRGVLHADPRGNLQDCTLEETLQGRRPKK